MSRSESGKYNRLLTQLIRLPGSQSERLSFISGCRVATERHIIRLGTKPNVIDDRVAAFIAIDQEQFLSLAGRKRGKRKDMQ